MNPLFVVPLLVYALGATLWPAQVTTTVLMTFGNYLAYRLWVFR